MGKEQQKKTELIGSIYEQSKHCGLDDAFFDKIDGDLEVLSSYFHTTKIQAFFIANLIPMSFQDRFITIRQLITYYNSNPMTMLNHMPGFCFHDGEARGIAPVMPFSGEGNRLKGLRT